jgi:uncharacterized membrane protein
VAVGLFAVTYGIDRAAYRGDLRLPSWTDTWSADAGRQILTTIVAAVITVVGVVFSITIVALTLASQQFGPRMLRNFIRDLGTQITLGTFVATFVFGVLALGSIRGSGPGQFVPQLSITVAMALVLVNLGVLIYFIHHMATSIQLPVVIAGIAADLGRSIDMQYPLTGPAGRAVDAGRSMSEALSLLDREGTEVAATSSGYLQFVGYGRLLRIASDSDGIIELRYRPGHFIVEGRPLARVWPALSAPVVTRALAKAHATGPQRTLTQDLSLSIDQLVEIAIRALSPAVNDTFTAMTCIDWLGDALCKISGRAVPDRARRDGDGRIRVIEAGMSYDRLLNRSFDNIRQAGRGMPAVSIRQLDSLAKIMEHTTLAAQRDLVVRQADMILRSSEDAVPEACDRDDIRRHHAAVATMRSVR